MEKFQITIEDGTILEVKFKERWFDNLKTEDLEGILTAIKLEEGKDILRFLFSHRSYFRILGNMGVSLLFFPFVTNYEKFSDKIDDAIKWSKERKSVEFQRLSQKFFPILRDVMIIPMLKRFESTQDRLEGVAEEERELILKEIQVGYIQEIGTLSRDEKALKEFVKHYVSTETISDGIKLAQNLFGSFFEAIADSTLKRVQLILREMCDGDFQIWNKVVNDLKKCKIINPFSSIIICPNEYCSHLEIIISDAYPTGKCSKCRGDALVITYTYVNETISWLKERMLDPIAFLCSYVNLKASYQYKQGKLIPKIVCYPGPLYVKNLNTAGEEKEVDVLLYSPTTQKAVIIESKVHQVTEEMISERLIDIANNDVKQLIDTLKGTGVNNGCYMTNLKMFEDDKKKIQEKIIVPTLQGTKIDEVEILSMTDGDTFISDLNNMLEAIEQSD